MDCQQPTFHIQEVEGIKHWFLDQCPSNIEAFVRENKFMRAWGRFKYSSHVRVEQVEEIRSYDALVAINTKVENDERGFDDLDEALEYIAAFVAYETADSTLEGAKNGQLDHNSC